MTIVEAIKKVLLKSKQPLTHVEIYKGIIGGDLYSFGAKDPKSVVRSKLRKHCFGIDFPSASPAKYFIIAKGTGKSVHYSLWDRKVKAVESLNRAISEGLPEEVIHSKHKEHVLNVSNQLLDCIKQSEPVFFEKLVVSLLLKMGYGWNESSAGEVCGGAGDEGIDGIISEDKLGLESIYIQAKRYRDNKVPPNEVREFIGAMVLKGARKGVFISSSDFTDQAKKHAQVAQNMNIALINGMALCELLISNGMGIKEVTNYPVYKIDNDFFFEVT